MSANQPDGYFALPITGNGSPVLVLHAWWGLNDTIKAFCNRLAEAGYVAFAPDLYHGKVTDQIAEAEALSSPLFEDLSQPRADIAAALKFLVHHVGETNTKVAVIGFSLGAFFALDISTTNPEHVRSVVLFYGTGPTDFSKSKAAYLGHFAAIDEFEPRANVDDLEQSLENAGRPVTFYHYDNTGHWFFEPDRQDAYNQEAADLAWERTLAFLRQSHSAL